MSWWPIINCLPITGPRASPVKKWLLLLRTVWTQIRHKKVWLDLHLNSVRSDVDPLMMFLGEYSKITFLCKQFEPDQARQNNVRPHSASTPCADPNGGEGVRRTPSKISQKYSFFSNWSRPLKNHKATKPHFLCMANIGTLAKRHLNEVSLTGRWWPAYSGIWILSPIIKLKKTCKSLTSSD